MSDQYPAPGGADQPEYLDAGPADPGRSGGPAGSAGSSGLDGPEGDGPGQQRPRRGRWVLAGAVSAVVLAGAAGWAAAQLLAGGDDPSVAVPASAVGYLAVDLDPSATQKIEALRMAKQFPALAEELDLGVRDDLRRWLFDQLQEAASCPIDYDTDIAPWLGDRMAVAAVPGQDEPVVPLLVVQVADRQAAAAGVTALEECAAAEEETLGGSGGTGQQGAEPGPVGVAFVGDYMLVTEAAGDAQRFADAAETASLADDSAFGDWMDEVGDPGVVTAYVSADAPRLMLDLAEGAVPPGSGSDLDSAEQLYADFEGLAGVLRFADGSMEAEVVSRGLPAGAAPVAGRTGPSLADLPETTAAAFSVSLDDGWLDGYAEAMSGLLGTGENPEDLWDQLGAESGLDLPEDIETLLGDGVSLSVDASVDLRRLDEASELPQLPVGLRIAGEPGAITGVLDKVLALLGPITEQVVVESGEDLVVVGLDEAYVRSLLEGGSLGESETLESVVPDADSAASSLYVNFDAGDGWLEALAEGDAEASANLAPLDALGVSGRSDGDVQRGLLRLTTD